MVLGQVIANRFEIIARAGSGGMGTVYRADDRVEKRPVAVKVLRATLATDAPRFEREAAVLRDLVHPAIVRYVASGRTMNGNLYLVTDWIDGQTLTDLLFGRGLSIAESLAVIRRVAEAVGFAHQCGVVHRDIKPANIMFPRGVLAEATLIDFGIALLKEDTVRFTEAGTILGTPSYMAPEQARAVPAIDARADVFGLGCVLYECLTGEMAFGGSNPLAVQAKVLMLNPTSPRKLRPEIPNTVSDLTLRMLSKKIAHRPQNGSELADVLGSIEADVVGISTAPLRRKVDDQKTQGLGKPAAATEQSESLVCLITGAMPNDYARPRDITPDRWQFLLTTLMPIAKDYGGHVELLGTGGFIMALSGADPAPVVCARAARCTLAIKAQMPELCLVLSVAESQSVELAIDRGAHTMELSVRRAILDGGLGGHGLSADIWIDPFAAGLLPSEFVVEAKGKTCRLIREADDQELSS